MPIIGAMFLIVLSIQSLQWERTSRKLVGELMASARGCVSLTSVEWLRQAAMDYWSLTFYAADLQGRRPRTMLLANDLACGTFARTGDASFVEGKNFSVIRPRRAGWFDFDDAQSRTERQRN